MPIQEQGETQASSEIPAHLNRWNWGAFLLNWIWGIGNSVWIALLCLIPLVNIVMMFVLGAKGSRWAWNARLWRDEAHFRSTQRKWAIAGVIVWLAFIALGLATCTGVYSTLRNSEAYRMTMAELHDSPAVKAALGDNFEAGYFLTGQINWKVDGSGAAQLQIPLKGSIANATAFTVAERQGGDWEIKVLFVRVDGRQEPIVVINKSNLPMPGGPLDT